MRQNPVVIAMLVLTSVSSAAAQSSVPRWVSRVSISASVGTLQPSRQSEFYRLLDNALAPGSHALHPQLVGGDVRMRLSDRWTMIASVTGGRQTVSSLSRAVAVNIADNVPQQTTFDLNSTQTVGARFLAWHSALGGAPDRDRLRVIVGAGVGSAHYRVHQWGYFVDATRNVFYADDFRSAGRGAIGYGSAAIEAPITRWAAISVEWSRQFGSAPMNSDYASFNHLDLGGSRLSAGFLFSPWQSAR